MLNRKPIHAAIAASIAATQDNNGAHWIAFLDFPLATRFADTIARAEAADYRSMRRLIRRPNKRAIHAYYRRPGDCPVIRLRPDSRYASSEATRADFEVRQNERRHDQHNTARRRAGLAAFDYGDFLTRRYNTSNILHRARLAIYNARKALHGVTVSQETRQAQP